MDCILVSDCRKVLNHLSLEEKHLNKLGDKCYCFNCYQDHPVFIRGGEHYEMPLMGVRFGLNFEDNFNLINNGINSYYPANEKNVKKIIESNLKNNDNYDNNAYSSPNFSYCLDPFISKPFKFEEKYYVFALQLRNLKNSYEIKETYPKYLRKERNLPEKIKLFSLEKKNAIIIGIIIYQIPNWSFYNTDEGVSLKNNIFFTRVFEKTTSIENYQNILYFKNKYFNSKFFEEYPEIKSKLKKLPDSLSKLKEISEKLKNIDEKLKTQVNTTDFARGCTNATGIAGTAMIFTPMLPIGVGLVGFSIFGRFAIDISDFYYEKKKKKCFNDILQMIDIKNVEYCENAKISIDEKVNNFEKIINFDYNFLQDINQPEVSNIAFSNSQRMSSTLRVFSMAGSKSLFKAVGFVGILIDSADILYRIMKSDETKLRKNLASILKELEDNIKQLGEKMEEYNEFMILMEFSCFGMEEEYIYNKYQFL